MRRTVCAVLLAACPALADEVQVGASKDNTLFESAAGALSNGKGQYLFAGQTGELKIRRALLAFDLAGAVPPGSTITAVTLALNMSKTITGPQDVAAHRVLEDWGEGDSDAVFDEGIGAPPEPGDVTWIHTFFDTGLWSVEGGTFVTDASAVTSVDGLGVYLWTGAGLVADVQAWVDGSAQNFGWVMIAPEDVPTTAKRFDSRDHPTEDVRPRLIVEFTPPCPADCDESGELDVDDFICFQTLFGLGDAGADCDGSGELDIDDFICFQTEFGLGC